DEEPDAPAEPDRQHEADARDGPPREVEADPAPPLGARPSGEPRDPFEDLRRLAGVGDVRRRGGLVGAVHACQSSIYFPGWQVVAVVTSPPGGPTAVRAGWSRPWPSPGRATPRPPAPGGDPCPTPSPRSPPPSRQPPRAHRCACTTRASCSRPGGRSRRSSRRAPRCGSTPRTARRCASCRTPPPPTPPDGPTPPDVPTPSDASTPPDAPASGIDWERLEGELDVRVPPPFVDGADSTPGPTPGPASPRPASPAPDADRPHDAPGIEPAGGKPFLVPARDDAPDDGSGLLEVSRETVTLADVGGLEPVKKR